LKQGAWNALLRPQRKFKCVGGNRLAQEEISPFAPKKVHIVTFVDQLSTAFGIIPQYFGFCQLALSLSQISRLKGGRLG
jgi:hypothetical protein